MGRILTANGCTKTMTEWSNLTGISTNTLSMRLKLGWSPDDAVNRKVRAFDQTYTVYDNRTDTPVAISEPAAVCAKRMGVLVSSFYSYVHRPCKRWHISVDEEV